MTCRSNFIEPQAGKKLHGAPGLFVMLVAAHHAPRIVTKGPRQLLAQLEPRPKQADLHVRLAQAQCFRSFFHGQTLDIAQEKDKAMLLIELRQRLVEQSLRFVSLDEFLRRLSPVRDEFRVRNFVRALARLGRFLQRNGVQPFAFADDLERRVRGDAVKPCGEPGLFSEIGEVFQRADESLLGDVLGVMRILHNAQGEGINMTFVPANEFLKGVELARLGAADKSNVCEFRFHPVR
jgi:hypothetical protein